MNRIKTLMIVAVLTASPCLVQAAPLVYGGNSATGNFWDRPIGNGPAISGLGPVEFHVQAFFTDTTASYDIDSAQSGWDGYLHLYEGSFDPLDQLNGLIAANDDGPGGVGTSSIGSVGLTAFTQYYLITSGYAPADSGSFTNTIDYTSGYGVLTLGEVRQPAPNSVPEPGTMALLGLGLAGMGLMRRRRRA